MNSLPYVSLQIPLNPTQCIFKLHNLTEINLKVKFQRYTNMHINRIKMFTKGTKGA